MTITREDLRAAVPAFTGTLDVGGLEQPVEILRDAQHVPHLRAASSHDAFCAQGFVHAQDRLWQMDYDRRRAAGRWAEYSRSRWHRDGYADAPVLAVYFILSQILALVRLACQKFAAD